MTVIGAGARFVGDLSGDDEVLVHGRFEGKIRVGKDVTVAPGGEVEGDVHARCVRVVGKVRGEIRATERVELAASSVVEGSVQAPKVVIAEGAQLTGSVAMAAGGAKESRPSEG